MSTKLPLDPARSVFRLDIFNGDASLDKYKEQGGYEALQKALRNGHQSVIDLVTAAGLRGRGGAAFPTGAKLKMVRENVKDDGFAICNADEGEPGTFKDRFIMRHNPYQLLEGFTLAAYAAGVSQGIIYIRHEYPEARAVMREAIKQAGAAGLLGNKILGSEYSFNIDIFSGAGSYLCGEETAMLSSIEGKKGRPRLKPPYPSVSGLGGKPTLINNVETLANIPVIVAYGAAWYRSNGTADSPGTKLISLSGDVENRGLYEVPYGVSFGEIIETCGGGIKGGREMKAVNIGGASGVVVPVDELDCTLDYGVCAKRGITIGSGAVFVMDDTRSILANVQNRLGFFLHESCGKCTPCREGLRQADKIVGRVLGGTATLSDIDNLDRYTRVLQEAAFCGLGQAAGNSISSSLKYFRSEYEAQCVDGPNAKKTEEAIA
jgi:NADH-quinone oxidoreductase subunit F